MKDLKHSFIFSCSLVTLLILYAILDFFFSGILYFVIQTWNENLAMTVFKWSFIILLLVQSISTIPAIIRYDMNKNTED